MKFNLLKNKEKLKINTVKSNTNINEETREKFILKGWIESNRKPTCTNKRTRGFLCRLHKLVLNGKMTFSCPTTCTDSYTRRENRCQIPFKTSLTRFKMDFSAGRSMVEMLGVLAIIGVLSIGGISGYTIAMRRYQANEILSAGTKYAAIIWTMAQQQMLNDPEKYIWYDIAVDHTWLVEKIDPINYYKGISFENTGIGGLPSGINDMAFETLTSGNSGISVTILIGFQTKELCETVKTMTDIGTQASSTDPCEERSDYNQAHYSHIKLSGKKGYFLLVPFYQK